MELFCASLSHDAFGECSMLASQRQYMSVDGGDSFSIAIDEVGTLYSWGYGFYGELGVHSLHGYHRISLPSRCIMVSCGMNHVLALSDAGRVFGWGWNKYGQVSKDPILEPSIFNPAEVLFVSNESVVVTAIACGGMHSLAIDSNGSVWSWGKNHVGQLGRETDSRIDPVPTIIQITRRTRMHQVAAGWSHTAIVDLDGRLFTFGWGLYHQLGHGEAQNETIPRLVDAFVGIPSGNVCSIACGMWHTAAVTLGGDVYTWGWGVDGQLGPRQLECQSQHLPSVVSNDDIETIAIAVACGARSTIVLCTNGDLLVWGQASSLSLNKILHNSRQVVQIRCGHSHVLCLTKSKR